MPTELADGLRLEGVFPCAGFAPGDWFLRFCSSFVFFDFSGVCCWIELGYEYPLTLINISPGVETVNKLPFYSLFNFLTFAICVKLHKAHLVGAAVRGFPVR
jgi:hypothetical protein